MATDWELLMATDWKARYKAQRELNNELLTWLNGWIAYEEDTSDCPNCCKGADGPECIYMEAVKLLEKNLE